ncbi:hypothetical protein O9993_05160 [Vibrio lentus]|nr:hypothetical protein [Vibrio lentus]
MLVSNKILVAASVALTWPAFADGNANQDAITAAVTSGKGMVELTTSGVIGVAALVFPWSSMVISAP